MFEAPQEVCAAGLSLVAIDAKVDPSRSTINDRMEAPPQHKVYPYLLRGLATSHSNQVWALDTTYIPMARGFVYLTVVVDVYSRRILAHRVAHRVVRSSQATLLHLVTVPKPQSTKMT